MAAMTAGAIASLAAMAVLGWLFYGPWQEVCTDWARQLVFEKRDAIFDLARQGKLDFASEDYRAIRSSLQKTIRFSHMLTFPRLFILSRTIRHLDAAHRKSNLQRAMDNIEDPEIRAQVQKLVMEALAALAISMLCKSAWFVIATIVVVSIACILGLTSKIIMLLARLFGEMIQVEAETAPSAHDEAALARGAVGAI